MKTIPLNGSVNAISGFIILDDDALYQFQHLCEERKAHLRGKIRQSINRRRWSKGESVRLVGIKCGEHQKESIAGFEFNEMHTGKFD